MNVLALDTASPQPTVALLRTDRLFEENLPADRRASEELLPGIARLLERAASRLEDCERIAVCSGPGSFTGVRVGLATAWGLSRALRIPLETVPSLEAVAEAARDSGALEVTSALDAGRGEVVIESFRLEGPRARSCGNSLRLPVEQAQDHSRGRLVCLPENLVPGASPALTRSLAAATALAVARHPREDGGQPLLAIYARASAAQEKRGAP